ncbi:hypothetical protein FB45DRAFT_169939 [Roridomyces roridus]|uniref:Uncharacterized protein n=1 Tax=Roridomyces roridus TaxID=1738132 RepID=A0AAD7BEM4_9AGAR|nr:hypothetical protein FB45DRAFT_169939 [Roridomyces roridus]
MSDSQLYARLLLPRGHGYPLFHPQPYDDLWDIRSTGTQIGDVGVVKDGCFDVLFNICYPADHPINRRFNRGLPEGFEQLEVPPADIAPQVAYHPPGADVSNTRITKRRLDIDAGVENNVFLPAGAGAVVEISASAKETAVLLLPDGAARWDLRPLRVFKDYALKHARSWYTWVNGRLGWMVESGDLYLITGVDKSSTWSVLATENRSEDLSLSLKLKAAQFASASGSCTWEWESTSSFANSGPRRQPGWERPAGSEPEKDQTLFLRGFKVTVRSSSWIKSSKALSITESKPAHILGKSGFVPYSSPRAGSASQSTLRSSRPGGLQDEMEASVDYYPNSSTAYHPGCIVNDYLLESSPNADVAVTHDGEWMSVVHPDEKMPEDSVLLERISGKYHILTAAGAVYLDHPIRTTSVSSKEDLAPKKKALLISIRSMGSNLRDLPPDVYADVHAMRRLLVERYGYSESDIVMLLDSGEGIQPTGVNIMRAIGDLVRGARKGDSFFFLCELVNRILV